MTENREHRALYDDFLLGLWHADPAGRQRLAEEIIAPDFVLTRGGGEARGPAAIVELIEQSHALFDDIDVALDVGPIADGDHVAARWTFRGAYRGGMPNVPAEPGTRVEFHGVDIIRIADGKVAQYWVSSDVDHLMAQLGG
ncbi:MAG TPA: ester cyclase [Actinopolymorphaceae bacterium]